MRKLRNSTIILLVFVMTFGITFSAKADYSIESIMENLFRRLSTFVMENMIVNGETIPLDLHGIDYGAYTRSIFIECAIDVDYDTIIDEDAAFATPQAAYINASNIGLKKGPGGNFHSIKSLDEGTIIAVYVLYNNTADGCGWFYIQVLTGSSNGIYGYVEDDYVTFY